MALQVQAPPCPLCGKPLLAVALGADTAPWLCLGDARGFWQAELDAANLLDPVGRHFGKATAAVQAAMLAERDTAVVRGTSARPDTLPLLTDDQLTQLVTVKDLAAGFVGQVKAEQQRRKAGR